MLADMVGSTNHIRTDHHPFPWQERSLVRMSLIERVYSVTGSVLGCLSFPPKIAVRVVIAQVVGVNPWSLARGTM